MIDKKEEEKQIRVAVYIRVSTEDQVEKYGLDMQKEAILNYFKSRGKFDDGKDKMILAGEEHIYIDDGVSGTFDIPQRKDFQRLVENIEFYPKDSRPFDAVAVYKVDRLARRLAILLKITSIFDKYEIKFISVNEAIDTSTPFGKAILGIMGVIAELEIETTKQRTMGGRKAAKMQGKYGATPPYGYSKDKLGYLVKLEKEAKTVRDIFSWCVYEGKTTGEMAKMLEEQKIISPAISTIKEQKKKGESRKINNDYFWRNETVKQILENEIYTGKFYFGKTKNRCAVPKNEWLLSDYKVPRIIEDIVFEEAQKKLKESANKSLLNRKREGDHHYLLTGLIKCGWCQKHSKSQEAHNWVGNSKQISKNIPEYSYYYKCSHKNSGKYNQLCPVVPIPAEQLESYVIAFIKKLLDNPKATFLYQQQLKSNKIHFSQLRKERLSIVKNINNIPKRKLSLSVQHENGIIGDKELLERNEDIANENKRLNIRLKEIDNILGEQELSEGYIRSFTEYAKRYSKILDDISHNEKEIYYVVHSLIDKIVIYSRKLDPEFDVIAGRKKDNQQIPNSILIKLRLPKELIGDLITQELQHLSQFAVRTDTV